MKKIYLPTKRASFLLLGIACACCSAFAQNSPTLNPHGSDNNSKTPAAFGGERPANAETVITALESATFDNRTGVAEFTGSVVVKDPQFTLNSDRLLAYLNAERKGLEKVEAIGNVVIRQENKDKNGGEVLSVARAGKAVFFPKSGDVELTDWPQITQGINAHVATEAGTKMILNRAGKINTIGSSRTMIVDTGEANR